MTDGTGSIVEGGHYGQGVHLEPWREVGDAGFAVQTSQEHVVLEDHWLPMVLRFKTTSQEPQLYFEVVVPDRGGGPRLTEFAFISRDPDSSGVRQADFREVQVSAIVEDFVAMFTVRVERGEDGEVLDTATSLDDMPGMTRFVGRMRAGRTSRDITPQLLERVADIYRENIAGYPTKAVEHHFQVSQRMAAEYVSRARKRGLLPPTKKGKKNA
jgi:hypothetical protein